MPGVTHKEAADLKQALEDRKSIDTAKGILMEKAALDEHDAFRRRQRLVSDQNGKLIEIAHIIPTAEEAYEGTRAIASPISAVAPSSFVRGSEALGSKAMAA